MLSCHSPVCNEKEKVVVLRTLICLKRQRFLVRNIQDFVMDDMVSDKESLELN